MIRITCAIGAACAFLALVAVPSLAAQQPPVQKQDTAALSESDKRYFDALAKANLAEVQVGNLALGKAASDEVKRFAKHMVDDHGRKLAVQRALGAQKRKAMPSAPDEKHKAAFKKLEGLSGAEFDRTYMEQMVQDHQATLALVKEIASNAEDPDLRAAGQRAIPDIEKHLQMAEQIAADTAGSAKVSSSQ